MRLIDEEQYQIDVAKIPMAERTFVKAWETAQNMPTIDAVPLVHGEWVQKKTALGKTYSICSQCKTDFKFYTDKGTLARLDMEDTNYCPNCGAKMEDKP